MTIIPIDTNLTAKTERFPHIRSSWPSVLKGDRYDLWSTIFPRLWVAAGSKNPEKDTGCIILEEITDVLLIGSHSECDLVIPDALPKHALMELENGHLYVTALTANGKPLSEMVKTSGPSRVYLNDQQIPSGVRTEVPKSSENCLVFGSDPNGCAWKTQFHLGLFDGESSDEETP